MTASWLDTAFTKQVFAARRLSAPARSHSGVEFSRSFAASNRRASIFPCRGRTSTPPTGRAFGKAEFVFDAQHFGLTYSRAALARAIPTADPAAHLEIRRFVAERWNYLQPDVLDRVMRVLVPIVLGGAPSQKKIADLLVTHPRTLNRVLQARGTSFREARNEARFEIAAQLLRDTDVRVDDVAQMLGYSQLSAFTRFFTGFAGLPPSEWRKQELAPPPQTNG